MEFDWNNPPFNLESSLTLQEIEESFEDPFAIRLLPDSPRFSVQARYFNLGVSVGGMGIFSVYRTNGKQARVLYARPFEPEERFFYQRRLDQSLALQRVADVVTQTMRAIAKWEEVPIFDSEEAEATFWAENKPDLRLMESAVAGNAEASGSVAISLRIDPRMLARIKRMAQSRYLNYQSMIKQWLSERLEDELRER